MDRAECLFADKDFAAVSLRKIIKEADVNLAAIHYHFGGKDELIEAIYLRFLQPISETLTRELLSLTKKESLEIEDVIEAFVRPIFTISSDDLARRKILYRLLARLHYGDGQEPWEESIAKFFLKAHQAFVAAAIVALPKLAKFEAHWGHHFLIGSASSTLFLSHKLEDWMGMSLDDYGVEKTIAQIVRYNAAGMRAMVSSSGV